MQKGKQVAAVNLNCYSSDYVHGLPTDTRFSIEVSAPGGGGSSHLVQLPVLDDMTNEPFIFSIKDTSEAKLMFRVFRATSTQGKKGILVGSGTALLENHQHCFGEKRESLIRERAVSILERDTLNFMGTVTFTFIIAKPFVHLKTPPLIKFPMENANAVQLVGHRGMFSTCLIRC
jgi:glycerophosphodiester phosphodiesterase